MDLLTLAAKITLDDSSYTKGINNATSMGEQLAGKMSAWTVAVGNLAADMISKAASTITGIYSNAMDSYADYQQLIGGVETLFKTSSNKVATYAANAYKTSGLSANDYMETVTSFSASLLQGLGGDTEAAADLAEVAITDMSDNANKMGTDISSIQTAYQGFAKQNYTMLDNLKLGYGGTADEMVRLINDSGILETDIKNLDNITFDQIIEAIHNIQDQMGITGTTAAEAAETISGSKDSLVAAWNNLMAAVGGSTLMPFNEAVMNFKESFSAYMTNLIPTMLTTIANSGTLVSAIADAITDLPTQLLAQVAEEGLGSGAQMISSLTEVVNWLIDNIVSLFSTLSIDDSKVTAFGTALGTFIGTTASKLLTTFPDLLTTMLDVGVKLAGSVLTGIWNGLFGGEADNRLAEINQEMVDAITDVEVQTGKAQALLTYLSNLEQKYGDAARETLEWKAAEEELNSILEGSSGVFETYEGNIQGAIEYLQQMTEELRKQAIVQALQNKLTSQLDMLGEYEAEKIMSEREIETATTANDTIQQKAITTAQAYAQEWLNTVGKESGSKAAIQEAENLVAGKIYNAETGEFTDVTEASLGELYNAAETFSAAIDKGSDSIWNVDEDDYILSPEVLSGLEDEYNLNQKSIEDNTSNIESLNEKIKTVESEVQITTEAFVKAEASINSFVDAATSASNKLSSINVVNGAGAGTGDETYMPKAVGIDYVPTNGFRAELHRGEAVLTKAENERRMSGYTDYWAMEDALTGAIESAMGRMNISMNGERVADLTTQRVSRNIDGNYHARVRSMGGY